MKLISTRIDDEIDAVDGPGIIFTVELQEYEVRDMRDEAVALIERGAGVGTTRARMETYDFTRHLLAEAKKIREKAKS